MVLATVTAALSYWVFVHWAGWLHLRDPHFIAQTLLIAIVVHELALWVMLELNRMPSLLVFGTFIGGAITLSKKGGRAESLRWSRLAAIFLAGVIGNLIAVAGYYVGGHLGWNDRLAVSRFLNLNGQLIVVNLLPIPFLDGGGFAKLLFDSVAEEQDMNYVRIIGLVIGLPILALALFRSSGWLILITFLLLGLQFFARHDDPNGSHSRLAMTVQQQRWWTVCYTGLMIIGALMYAFTSKWAVRI